MNRSTEHNGERSEDSAGDQRSSCVHREEIGLPDQSSGHGRSSWRESPDYLRLAERFESLRSAEGDSGPLIYAALDENFDLENAASASASRIECQIEQRSPLWWWLRSGRISSTRAGALLRRSKKLAASIRMELAYHHPMPDEIEQVDLQRGRDLEPVALATYQFERLGTSVRPGGIWLDRSNPWVCTSPDACVDDDGGVEAKCPRLEGHIGALDGVPGLYVAQCQWHLFVTGWKWLDFVSYCEDPSLTETERLIINRVLPHDGIFQGFEKALTWIAGEVAQPSGDFDILAGHSAPQYF